MAILAKIYGVSDEDREERLAQLTTLFELKEEVNQTIDSFSHGMRQKVIVIGALVSNPNIWILDEPLTGLDPQASFDLKEMMKAHAASGHTVLFSTHVLSVAEQLCDRIGILKKGKLIFVGTIDELKEHHPDKDLRASTLNSLGVRRKKRGDGMNWSTIWELIKINILYSNPQSLANLKSVRKNTRKKTSRPIKA